jgi:LPXTG-motif cell wall-anchored protein
LAPSTTGATVLGVTVTQPTSTTGSLPTTGSRSTLLFLAGLLVIIVGLCMVQSARELARRQS